MPRPCQHVGNIEEEEVAVQRCLDQASIYGNGVKVTLHIVPVDPVEDIECPVGTQGKEIVPSNHLSLVALHNHEQLGRDGYSLQVDGKRPENLHHRKLVVKKEGQKE